MSAIIDHMRVMMQSNRLRMDEWFEAAHRQTPPCFYSSVDIRHSGYKLAPVDTNLFPAGFNHLSKAAIRRAVEQIGRFIEAQARPVTRALIIPENHTRNLGYLDNLIALKSLLEAANLSVEIGSLMAESGQPLDLVGSTGAPLVQHPLRKQGNQLSTESGFVPDLIVVNNDMTSGSPQILKGVTQLVVPQTGQGWYRRRKTIHFEAYDRTVRQFADAFTLDPWLLSAFFHKCGRIDFRERKGIDCIALGVEKVLRQIRTKYEEYGITDEPYVYVKADSGTYGMGIMTVRSGEEVTEMNKRIRNKMDVIKEGVHSTEVIIQEGVPTVDLVDNEVAEPMLYLVNGEPVGGAYRVNSERDRFGNLNASGMRFHGMCDEEEATDSAHTRVKHCNFMVFGLIAKLATLAASREEYGEEYMI